MTTSPASLSALQTPIRWPAEAIWQAVQAVLPGFTVEVLPEIDSSNSELMRRFRGGAGIAPQTEPILLVAEQQTAGRGRLGRNWQSRRGDSLTFSLGLPLQPLDWAGLSLVVGISLAESLDPAGDQIGLKWPNDLWLRGKPGKTGGGVSGERKLAGILLETANGEGLRYVVIGIGINLRPADLALPQAVSSGPAPMPPGYLQDMDAGMDVAATLLRVVPALVQNVQAFEHFGFAPFQSRFARRDVLLGRAVQLFGDKNSTQGVAHGVSEGGALLVHTPAGMKEITSSEVSVRPAEGAADPRPPEGKPAC
jgi:BirA family biotin operon repressor/biotin-[acetyl-CoA-carboxylase] ligase